MTTVEIMAEYGRLGQLHDALGLLVALKIISDGDRIRLTRKFMDDRPAFKEAVAEAMGGKVISAPADRN